MTPAILKSEGSFSLMTIGVVYSFLSWKTSHKWIVTVVVSAYTFISPVASSIIAPASKEMAMDLGITNSTVRALATSIFVMGFGECTLLSFCMFMSERFTGFGPLIFAPLSEIYGRVPILLIANAWFFGMSTLSAYLIHSAQAIVKKSF